MLFVERSNRTELLFEGLAERLGRPGRNPFARAVVVVQGAGMERWIAQRLADRFGVCANVAFPFPRPFLEDVFATSQPESGATRPAPVWDLERMTFALAASIDAERDAREYAPLVRHLGGNDGDWRLVQLARQIAIVFDQYVTYRPEWVLHWEGRGPAPSDLPPDLPGWQRRLFRALGERLGPGHMAGRALEFLASTEVHAPALRRRFPDAVEVFAVSTLPRLHLEVLRGLASVIDVRLSLLAPSRAWYGELFAELRADEASREESPIAGLLAGLGRLGADFQRVLVEVAAPDGGERELFVRPDEAAATGATLLHRLQGRLLDLEEADASEPGSNLPPDDDSIRVHLCHGPRRELEVVESLLRDAFERDPTLRPEDVIVMAPDIDAIAGEIEAVFGPGSEEPDGIPYRVADRGTWRRSPVAEAFRQLLALATTRMARSAVFDWLAKPSVAARFGLDERAVESLAEWAERAGVRFGVDESQRAMLALPAERAHTLAGGLDRLVLAHAMGEVPEVVRGVTPIGLDAFDEPDWIGALGEVASLLDELVRECRTLRSLSDWTRWLEEVLARSCVRMDANSHEHLAILAVLERLRTAAEAARFTREIPFEAIREQVLATLEASPSPQAFLSGGVTFCQLVPLRAIPFRMVVVTGLVDGRFPRSRASIGFDAMARHPRPGDRSLRDDDRHLFLEAILSARDRLVLTIPARDLRDGQPRPPSIVVSELLDSLSASFARGEEARRLRDRLVVAHPLQESSPRYFERGRDPRLVSRSARAHRAALARARAMARVEPPVRRFLAPERRLADPVSLAAALPSPLALDELIERVLRSTRWFAREAIGLRLPRPEARAGDLDPIALEPLEQAAIGQALFDAIAGGRTVAEATARACAGPLLPQGLAGRLLARPLAAEARRLATIAAEHRRSEPLPDFAFELAVPRPGAALATVLVGRLDGLHRDARVEAGHGRLASRRESVLWIRHLVLCALAARGEPLPTTSIAIGRAPSGAAKDEAGRRVVVLRPVADPLELLARLVEWAESARECPLPFFERSSRLFAKLAHGSESEDQLAEAWRTARSEFDGRDDNGNRRAELDQELETVCVWEGSSPIAPATESGLPRGFDELASGFFGPLFDAREIRSR